MKATLLLVEDSKLLRVANARVLTKAGYNVISAEDGEKALGLAQECLPDLILLDMLLPKLGGPQVLEALKKNPTTAHIPVIVLSSLSQSNEGRLKSDGAAAYFEKSRLESDPNWGRLIHKIESILNTRRQECSEKCL